jgi:hypothetical protein
MCRKHSKIPTFEIITTRVATRFDEWTFEDETLERCIEETNADSIRGLWQGLHLEPHVCVKANVCFPKHAWEVGTRPAKPVQWVFDLSDDWSSIIPEVEDTHRGWIRVLEHEDAPVRHTMECESQADFLQYSVLYGV